MHKQLPIRETITYPKVTVTPQCDPCHCKSSPYEHVLTGGHLITTPEPDELCAPNCHRSTNDSSRKAPKMSLSKALKKEFYCDACVEVDAEREIDGEVSCKTAEKHRIGFRKTMAAKRGKANKFRKCYIAQKSIAVPCDQSGDIIEDYYPYVSVHPADTAWPPTGDNMFEDVEVIPTRSKRQKKKELSGKARPLARAMRVSEDEESSANEAASEDVDETVAEGARWLRERAELERRRAEEGTPITRRRRAAARPIVISSSPDSGISNLVVNSSSPLTTVSGPREVTPIPAAPPKTRDRKRKRATRNEAPTAPLTPPEKRAKATPKVSGSARVAMSASPSSKPVLSVKKSNNGIGGAATQSKCKMATKSSKPVRSIL